MAFRFAVLKHLKLDWKTFLMHTLYTAGFWALTVVSYAHLRRVIP